MNLRNLRNLITVFVDELADKHLADGFFGRETNFFIADETFYEGRFLAANDFFISHRFDSLNLRGFKDGALVRRVAQ